MVKEILFHNGFLRLFEKQPGLLTTLLLAGWAGLAGGLLAHRGLREKRPWLVLGLAPHLGACLLAGLALLTLDKPVLLYALVGMTLLAWMWPGPGWDRPRPALTGVSLLALGLTCGTALCTLDNHGWRPLETARFMRGWQGWPGPGLDVLLAALGWPECDPLAVAWGVRVGLRLGGALLLVGVAPHVLVGLAAALLTPVLPDLAPLGIYLTARMIDRTLPLRGAPLLAVLPLVSPELMPWWWLAGLLACAVGVRGAKAWAVAGLAYALCLGWPFQALPYPHFGRPQLPGHWRQHQQGLSAGDLEALEWLAVQALPGERLLSERPAVDRALGDLCGLEPAPRDAVWQAYRETGRADLLSAAGVNWLWLDVSAGPVRNPLLTPGPRFGSHQLFGVLPAGPYVSDYRYPVRVTLPRGPLHPGRFYPLTLDVTNHDTVSRRLGWLRVQVYPLPPLDILAGRGRMAPEGGDRLTLPLVTPPRPGKYVLEVIQPHTSEGRPWVLARVPLEVVAP